MKSRKNIAISHTLKSEYIVLKENMVLRERENTDQIKSIYLPTPKKKNQKSHNKKLSLIMLNN